jgi:hypothetical protein
MEQKDLFEASVDRLPYVECSPNGRESMKAIVCIEEKIETYPTWIIKGRRHEGVFKPEQLARYSGYTGIKE